MKASQTDLAWLAGFLDGEGTIGLANHTYKKTGHKYLRPHFQAPNTDKRLIDRMADIVELVTGKRQSVTFHRTKNPQHKDMWRTCVHTQWQLQMLLPLLFPYLVSKRRQAEIVLEFCQRRSARRCHKWYEFKELDEAAYHECLSLNKRGVNTPLFAPSLTIVKEASNG